MSDSPSIALALGSGASRGWSHVGVINALVDAGIEPDIVCGTSVGAIVGASYVAGNLSTLEEWVLNSNRTDVYRFFDVKFSQSGFVDIKRLEKFLHENVAARVTAQRLHVIDDSIEVVTVIGGANEQVST